MDLEDIFNYVDDEAMKADGFDDCIIGMTQPIDSNSVLVYSEQRIIAKLISDGMDYFEAHEYYGYNIAGAYLGKGTPIFMTEREDLDDGEPK